MWTESTLGWALAVANSPEHNSENSVADDAASYFAHQAPFIDLMGDADHADAWRGDEAMVEACDEALTDARTDAWLAKHGIEVPMAHNHESGDASPEDVAEYLCTKPTNGTEVPCFGLLLDEAFDFTDDAIEHIEWVKESEEVWLAEAREEAEWEWTPDHEWLADTQAPHLLDLPTKQGSRAQIMRSQGWLTHYCHRRAYHDSWKLHHARQHRAEVMLPGYMLVTSDELKLRGFKTEHDTTWREREDQAMAEFAAACSTWSDQAYELEVYGEEVYMQLDEAQEDTAQWAENARRAN